MGGGAAGAGAAKLVKATDIDLARLARSRGWVQDDELERALLEADRYQALGLEKSVDEILIEGGHLTAEQARSLRDALGLSLRSPRIGDYEVVRRIGIGGMGSVFEARHVRLRQRIALKVLLPRLAKDSRATERFLEEARTLARLNHPNLVHAVDAGRDDELYYLAMEYVEGENLLQRLMRDGPLEPRRSLDVARDVCRALCALEEKGLVHRDVKPANILVAADGTVRLADFGLLGPAEEEGAGAAPLCGTPHYMSPEQVERRGEVDGRSDLYALAATWYHLVVGRPPFVGKSTREIILGHLHSPVPPPSSLRKEVPEPIERVILRWLAKERSERPGTCREALAELDGLARELDRRALSWPLVRRVLAIATALALAALLAWLLAPRGREPDGPVRGEAPVAKAPDLAPAPAPAAQPPPSSTPALPPVPAPAPAPGPAGGPETAIAAGPAETQVAAPGAAPGDGAPRPPPAPVLPRLLEALEVRATRAREAAARLGAEVSRPAAGFERLRALARTFHATFVALEPWRDPPAGVVLRYELEDPRELDDFRAPPGSWSLTGGAVRGLAEPAGESLETIAWFVPPLGIEGDLPAAASLVVGFGDLRVAPGTGPDGRVWMQEGDEELPVLSAPEAPAGEWSIAVGAARVEMVVAGRTFGVDVAVPARGRILFRIAAGKSLERLAIHGALEPVWAAERARLAGATGR